MVSNVDKEEEKQFYYTFLYKFQFGDLYRHKYSYKIIYCSFVIVKMGLKKYQQWND